MRVSFLADGFNLYHSVREAEKPGVDRRLHWLDLSSLFASYLKDIDRWAVLGDVYYFSALATHMQHQDPNTILRHRTYIAALQATGVQPVLGSFKQARRTCPTCKSTAVRHEEKETDVAIGAHLVEWAATASCDAAYIVSGDSDLTAAVRVARRVAPDLVLGALFPFARTSSELRTVVDHAIKIKKGRYGQYQLPDPVVAASGERVAKPASW